MSSVAGVLVHLVDATATTPAPTTAPSAAELAAYGEGLADKAEIVALSKVDAVDEVTLKPQAERLKRAMRSYGPPVADGGKRAGPFLLSSATQRGVTEVLRATLSAVGARRRRRRAAP